MGYRMGYAMGYTRQYTMGYTLYLLVFGVFIVIPTGMPIMLLCQFFVVGTPSSRQLSCYAWAMNWRVHKF